MRLLLSITLLFLVANAEAQFRSSITGSWYNPSEAGHGLAVEVLPDDQILIYWYTYDKQGDPMYVMGIGKSTDSHYVEIDAFRTEGMHFGDFDPNDQSNIPFGKIMFGVYSCDTAGFGWQSSEFGSGETDMHRLSTTSHNACAEVQYAGFHNTSILSEEYGDSMVGISLVSPLGSFAFMTTTGRESAVITGYINGNEIHSTAYRVDGGIMASGVMEIAALPDGFVLYDNRGNVAGMSARLESVSMHSNSWGNGTHRVEANGAMYTITIKDNGVSGSGSNGCKLQGTVYQEDPDFDVTNWDIDVTSCEYSGHYQGLGGMNALILENGYSGLLGVKQ